MNSVQVLIAAEKIVLDPKSTPEKIQEALKMVEQTGDQKAVEALRRTIRYEKAHHHPRPA